MKKSIFVTLIALLFWGFQAASFAQNNNGKPVPQLTPEQRAERRANGMVKTLMLDDAKAAQFVPLYKKYILELQSCQFRNKMKGFGDKKVETMKDSEIKELLDLRFSESRRILDIREKYYKSFSKLLTPRQLWTIYSREKMMAGKMKKEMERRKNGKGKRGRHMQHRPGQGNACPNCDNSPK